MVTLPHPNTKEQTLAPEDEMNAEIKRKPYVKRRRFYPPSGIKTGKMSGLKLEKINRLITNISMNNITEFSKLIYAEGKISG